MKNTLVCLLYLLCLPTFALAGMTWTELEPGLEYAVHPMTDTPLVGNGSGHFLRIDPARFEFVLVTQKELGGGKSAKDWAKFNGLLAGINAGMFQMDGESNVGYMRSPTAKNNGGVNAYKSVFAFAPKGGKTPQARMFDLDETKFKEIAAQYAGIIQNLRLIKRPGENRWSKQDKRWSEAALAEDDKGRILFIFVRSPLTMHDFNNTLLSLPLGIQCAHHLEGGPEASFVINHPNKNVSLFGSYETNFMLNDLNKEPWPIPNVLGIRRR